MENTRVRDDTLEKLRKLLPGLPDYMDNISSVMENTPVRNESIEKLRDRLNRRDSLKALRDAFPSFPDHMDNGPFIRDSPNFDNNDHSEDRPETEFNNYSADSLGNDSDRLSYRQGDETDFMVRSSTTSTETEDKPETPDLEPDLGSEDEPEDEPEYLSEDEPEDEPEYLSEDEIERRRLHDPAAEMGVHFLIGSPKRVPVAKKDGTAAETEDVLTPLKTIQPKRRNLSRSSSSETEVPSRPLTPITIPLSENFGKCIVAPPTESKASKKEALAALAAIATANKALQASATQIEASSTQTEAAKKDALAINATLSKASKTIEYMAEQQVQAKGFQACTVGEALQELASQTMETPPHCSPRLDRRIAPPPVAGPKHYTMSGGRSMPATPHGSPRIAAQFSTPTVPGDKQHAEIKDQRPLPAPSQGSRLSKKGSSCETQLTIEPPTAEMRSGREAGYKKPDYAKSKAHWPKTTTKIKVKTNSFLTTLKGWFCCGRGGVLSAVELQDVREEAIEGLIDRTDEWVVDNLAQHPHLKLKKRV